MPYRADKMLSASSYPDKKVPLESIAVVENLERIANNGVYYSSQGDRKGRDQVAGFNHLKTVVYIDGKPYTVDMRVRVYDEKTGGDNRLYYFTPEAVTIKKQDDGDSPTGTLRERTIQKTGETPSPFDTSVPPAGQSVKGQGAQMESGLVLPRGRDMVPPPQRSV